MGPSLLRIASGLGLVLLCTASAALAADPVDGEAVYGKRCASCHDHPLDRIPPKASLQNMSSTRILRVLDFGAMMTVAYVMNRPEREAVAAYLGKPGAEPGPPASAFCKDRTVNVDAKSKFVWNGWSPASDNARYVPGEVAGLSLSQVPRLKLKWAFGFEGDISAMAQPTVVGNQIFVGSAAGTIHAMRADTGCLQWTYQATGSVRSAIVAAALPNGKHALLFGDLIGWYYALEAESGKLLWKKKVEDHDATRVTGASAVNNGIVYIPVASWEEARALNPDYPCCTFRGSLVALRVRDGAQIWKTYTIPEPPRQTGKTKTGTATYGPSGAAIWGGPTLDPKRGVIYVTTGDNYSFPASSLSDAIVALDLKTGKVVWSRQTLPNDAYNSSCGGGLQGPNCPEDHGPDYDFGSSAILAKLPGGRDVLLAGQKSAVVYALDPDKKGEILWQTRVGKGGTIGGVQWGMSSDGQNVYAAVSDAVFKTTPLARVVDPAIGGGLTALRIDDGRQVWHKDPAPCAKQQLCSPAQSAALTAIPGVVFSGSVDGHLRAYSTEEGKIIWDIDTERDYTTVNGVKANGGSLDGPGPVIVNGMLFVNSGYSRYGGTPGNVLLAFGVE